MIALLFVGGASAFIGTFCVALAYCAGDVGLVGDDDEYLAEAIEAERGART